MGRITSDEPRVKVRDKPWKDEKGMLKYIRDNVIRIPESYNRGKSRKNFESQWRMGNQRSQRVNYRNEWLKGNEQRQDTYKRAWKRAWKPKYANWWNNE